MRGGGGCQGSVAPPLAWEELVSEAFDFEVNAIAAFLCLYHILAATIATRTKTTATGMLTAARGKRSWLVASSLSFTLWTSPLLSVEKFVEPPLLELPVPSVVALRVVVVVVVDVAAGVVVSGAVGEDVTAGVPSASSMLLAGIERAHPPGVVPPTPPLHAQKRMPVVGSLLLASQILVAVVGHV